MKRKVIRAPPAHKILEEESSKLVPLFLSSEGKIVTAETADTAKEEGERRRETDESN